MKHVYSHSFVFLITFSISTHLFPINFIMAGPSFRWVKYPLFISYVSYWVWACSQLVSCSVVLKTAVFQFSLIPFICCSLSLSTITQGHRSAVGPPSFVVTRLSRWLSIPEWTFSTPSKFRSNMRIYVMEITCRRVAPCCTWRIEGRNAKQQAESYVKFKVLPWWQTQPTCSCPASSWSFENMRFDRWCKMFPIHHPFILR